MKLYDKDHKLIGEAKITCWLARHSPKVKSYFYLGFGGKDVPREIGTTHVTLTVQEAKQLAIDIIKSMR